MSWEDILKRKTKAGMSLSARRLADRVITATPKTINTILDDMYNQLERDKKAKRATGGRMIPTRNELARYLGTKYSRVRLSEKTQKPIQGNEGLMHYYKEE